MNFQISDKVVCVDDAPRDLARFPERFEIPNGFIKNGEVYVVEGIAKTKKGTPTLILSGKPAFYLSFGGIDLGYAADRFRRLEELKDEARALKDSVSPPQSPRPSRPRRHSFPTP